MTVTLQRQHTTCLQLDTLTTVFWGMRQLSQLRTGIESSSRLLCYSCPLQPPATFQWRFCIYFQMTETAIYLERAKQQPLNEIYLFTCSLDGNYCTLLPPIPTKDIVQALHQEYLYRGKLTALTHYQQNSSSSIL